MFITNDIELAAAVEHMRAAGTDLAEYELKTAAGGFPKTMPDSISAFANGAGGTIVFGISEKKRLSFGGYRCKDDPGT